MMTQLEMKVKLANEFNDTYTVVEVVEWLDAYIEKSYLPNQVRTYFYWKDGHKLSKQQVFRKYYTDKKGTYIKWHGHKVYFKF